MNSFSHFIVARHLHRYIKKQYGVELGGPRFIYWNIMTDFRKPYKTPPHKPDCWENTLRSAIEELSGQDRTRCNRVRHDVAKRLGVICHFYADFFCFPHNDAYQGTYWQHIKYELDLYRFMRRSFTSICEKMSNNENDDSRDAEDFGRACFLKKYELLRREYLMKEPSFEHDVVYTLLACRHVVSMIVRSSDSALLSFDSLEQKRKNITV